MKTRTSHKPSPEAVDESTESELTIQPDGRVYAFGITGELAAVLAAIPTADGRTRRRLERIARLDADAGSRPARPSPTEETDRCPTRQG